MFFIFGWGRVSDDRYSYRGSSICPRCRNTVGNELAKVTTWFTLFFIPAIPYKVQYGRVCPICGYTEEINKEIFNRIVGAIGHGR